MKQLVVIVLLVLVFGSCQKESPVPAPTPTPKPVESSEPTILLPATTAPFDLIADAATFHENISYGEHTENSFDFFMPNNDTPSSLCMIIHSGAFVGGDKGNPYKDGFFQELIDELLMENIAVASINYRLIEVQDSVGILKCLEDSKRALQYLRYHAGELNFDKEKVALIGPSAGASTAMWIGFSDDMKDVSSEDPVVRESTRVRAVIGTGVQSNYDVLEWHNNVFSEYQSEGLDYLTIKGILTQTRILAYYGARNNDELFSEEIEAYRDKVNMLQLMSADDPEFYIWNEGIPNTFPAHIAHLYHHPLHVKALQDRAASAGARGIFHCPELGLDVDDIETIPDFILRKISN